MGKADWEGLKSAKHNFGGQYSCRSTCVQMIVNEALHMESTLGVSKQLGGARQYVALGVLLVSDQNRTWQ